MPLVCGHEPSPHGEHTTGTAHFNDREICWDCSNKLEQFYMGQSTQFCAYVSGDGKSIQTWPGGALLRVYSLAERRSLGMKLWHVKAVDDETGARWYGTGCGRGMFIRLNRKVNS